MDISELKVFLKGFDENIKFETDLKKKNLAPTTCVENASSSKNLGQ